MADIQFVHEDSAQIIAELKADMEVRLSKQIAPATPEMGLVQAFAYREMMIRAGMNDTARQNLVAFSRGSALEALGALVGVNRLPPAAALCSIHFSLVPGHAAVTIPAGLRIQSIDGKVIFQTTEAVVCGLGVDTADVIAAAAEVGEVGNDYAIGNVAIILDPQAYLDTAENSDITAGGSDEETDDNLRERIKLAPASFSVAGPEDAYIFFAKSAHPSIVDVAITSPPETGEVHIFPLMEGGQMPSSEILTAVEAICNSKKVRPLTDTVIVAAPDQTDYAIEVNITLLPTAISGDVIAQIQTILETYKTLRQNFLGLDVVLSKISSLCMIPGVYDAVVTNPGGNIEADPQVYTNCTGITVNFIGTHDE